MYFPRLDVAKDVLRIEGSFPDARLAGRSGTLDPSAPFPLDCETCLGRSPAFKPFPAAQVRPHDAPVDPLSSGTSAWRPTTPSPCSLHGRSVTLRSSRWPDPAPTPTLRRGPSRAGAAATRSVSRSRLPPVPISAIVSHVGGLYEQRLVYHPAKNRLDSHVGHLCFYGLNGDSLLPPPADPRDPTRGPGTPERGCQRHPRQQLHGCLRSLQVWLSRLPYTYRRGRPGA